MVYNLPGSWLQGKFFRSLSWDLSCLISVLIGWRRRQCTLIQFVDNTKLRHTVNTLQDRAAIQRGRDRPGEWENKNLMKVSKDKRTWCGLTPLHLYELGTGRLGSSCDGKDLHSLVTSREPWQGWRLTASWAASTKMWSIDQGKWLLPFTQHSIDLIWNTLSSLGPPS